MRRFGAILLLLGLLPACAHEPALGRKWVHGLDIRGNAHFSDGAIEEGLAIQQTGWWPFAAKHYFDLATLQLDLKRIQAFYNERGYFDARVLNHDEKDRGPSVDLRITVSEGTPTRITGLRVDGLDALPEKLRRKLLKPLPLKPGNIFVYRDYEASKNLLIAGLKQAGYAYAKVEGRVEVNRDQHAAAVDLKAAPGPQVRIGRIIVHGNGPIPADPITRRLTMRPGDTFSPRELELSESRVYDLGVFSSVRLSLAQPPQSPADVTIDVVPAAKLREVRLGGGLAIERVRQEVRLRGEWTIHNFLGGLRTLRLRTKPAYVVMPSITNIARQGPAAENDISLEQPDLFRWDVTLRAVVGYDLNIAEAYQYHGPRGQLGLERGFWRQRIFVGLGYNLQYLTFFNIVEAAFNPALTPLGVGFTNPYRLAFLDQSFALDLRDSRFDPHSGFYLGTRAEEGFTAIGSKFSYLKASPEARVYLPLGRRTTLAGRALFGWIYPRGAEDSPITRRFYLGGPASQRGFSFGRLSPQVYDPSQDRYVPVGGDGEVLFSGEVRLQLFRLKGSWLSIVPFFDAGDVTPKVSQLDLGNLHLASGADLVYQTPVGPVRAGLGVRLNRLSPEGPNGLPNPDPGQRYAFHITIGEAF
ncbi:MAG TPA: BamA/TamA family outer membrane protein [Polyangia bacterium]|jgi:translocation and assembly module TamA